MSVRKAKKKEEPQEEIEPIGAEDSVEEESLEDMEQAKNNSRTALSSLNHSDLFANFDPDEEEDIESNWSDPRVTRLEDPPYLHGGGASSTMFGQSARTIGGRATSPKLMAQAANFPNCTQLRIWKWENGTPVGLGAIDSEASEEDLVREFFDAMPKKGEGKCQFRLRPIDMNGNELGTEINCIISEHHAAIQKLRRMKDAEKEEEEYGSRRKGKRHWEEEDSSEEQHFGGFNPQFDRIMSTAEKRADILEKQLEMERNELRRREEQRMKEHVDLANSATSGIHAITERMMSDESKRAERALQMQTEQSQTLITTLTSIFAQQQTMLQSQMESQRRQDEYRLEQERQRYERERAEQDSRRERERLELEERRYREREEYERRMREERDAVERRIAKEQKELELRLQREREDMQLKIIREKEERESREKWFYEERLRRENQEKEDAKQREHDRQRTHERMMRELEIQQQKDREHAERMMALSKQELQNKTFGGLGEMIPMATGMLKKIGLEPLDVVQKIFAPEKEETSPWAETLPKLLGAGADIARVALTGGANQVQPIAPMQLPQLPMNKFDEDEDEEIDYRRAMQKIRRPPPQADLRKMAIGDDTDAVISYKDTTLDREPPIMENRKSQTNLDIAANAGMTLGEQRDARNALTNLVRTLHKSDQGEWETHITTALMSEPKIFSYIQAVSVKSAMQEAGADLTLTGNIINALKASALVPNDLNYGV